MFIVCVFEETELSSGCRMPSRGVSDFDKDQKSCKIQDLMCKILYFQKKKTKKCVEIMDFYKGVSEPLFFSWLKGASGQLGNPPEYGTGLITGWVCTVLPLKTVCTVLSGDMDWVVTLWVVVPNKLVIGFDPNGSHPITNT